SNDEFAGCQSIRSSSSNDESMSGMYVIRPRCTSSSFDLGGSALPAGAPGTGGSTTGENTGTAGAPPSGPGWVRDQSSAVVAARAAVGLLAGEGGGGVSAGGGGTAAADG